MSLQRYPRSPDGRVGRAPRSWGALPIARDREGRRLVPLRDDEALWLGLSTRLSGFVALVSIVAKREDGRVINLATGQPDDLNAAFLVPPTRAADGIRGPGVTLALTRVASGDAEAIDALEFHACRSRQPRPPEVPRTLIELHQPDGAGESSDTPAEPVVIETLARETWVVEELESTRISLVDPDTYLRSTGVEAPAPLKAADVYRGYRLP